MIQSYVADSKLDFESSVCLPCCATYLKLIVEPFFSISVFSSATGHTLDPVRRTPLQELSPYGVVQLRIGRPAIKPLQPG